MCLRTHTGCARHANRGVDFWCSLHVGCPLIPFAEWSLGLVLWPFLARTLQHSTGTKFVQVSLSSEELPQIQDILGEFREEPSLTPTGSFWIILSLTRFLYHKALTMQITWSGFLQNQPMRVAMLSLC